MRRSHGSKRLERPGRWCLKRGKETYTRLNENFLKRAQAIEERSEGQAIADDIITAPDGEPEERQANFVESSSD
jgi:hypothetical protein